MGGDGVVTMRQAIFFFNGAGNCLNVKGHMGVKPGKTCIPLVTHQ
jgi:hypothetical protein